MGGVLDDIAVISFDEFCRKYNGVEVIIAVGDKYYPEIKKQVGEAGIAYRRSNAENEIFRKERLLSYSQDMKDVLLYHLFKDESNIFYIDVGCNDPIDCSDTKLLYERLNARGINIDMQSEMIERMDIDRPEDINLCTAVGNNTGKVKYYKYREQGLMSTVYYQDIFDELEAAMNSDITTLENICDEYIGENEITFLKVDVEGYEKQVLEGINLKKHRPILIIAEAIPDIIDGNDQNIKEWEQLLSANGYIYVYQHGADKYFLAEERRNLKEKFIPWTELFYEYGVFRVSHTWNPYD